MSDLVARHAWCLSKDDRDQHDEGADELPGVKALAEDGPAKECPDDRVEQAQKDDRASPESAQSQNQKADAVMPLINTR